MGKDSGIAIIDLKATHGDIGIVIEEGIHGSLRITVNNQNQMIISDLAIYPDGKPFVMEGIKKAWINDRIKIDKS